MKTEKLNYKFIPVPLRLTIILDEKCTKVLTHLIQLHFAFADENDLFFRSIDLLSEETQLSKRVLNAVLVTLNNLYIVDVYSVGQSRGKKTNQFRINFNIIEVYDSIEFEKILTYKIKTLDYTDKSFKVEYHNVQNLITKSDNGSDNNLQNLITKSVLEQKLKEYSQNLITKSAKINHNIDNTIIDNTYKNNIGPNNIIYISEQEEKEKSNSKVNCYISEKEIEEYNNSVNSSEAESNFIAESETGKENLKENNIDNSKNVIPDNKDNNISTVKSDNSTANAELESNNSVNSNIDNSNKEEKVEESVNSNNVNSNKEEIEESKESVNSNEENTAVLSHSNQLNEESVISTEKMSENGLKQAKTRELGIVKKTDNSNSVKSNSTANAVTEETVYSNIDNSKEVEGNNNRDNSNDVKPNNTANAVTEKVDNLNSVKPVMEEIESNNSVNSNSVNSENNLDNSNYNNLKKKEIEEETNSVNSNEGINGTIAEGDNSTANAVQEFRNKCTKYTIILKGEKIEIDRTIDEFVKEYYSEIMNNILTTKEFDKQRKIFNKMIVDNNLNDTKYNEMCDKLDVRYSRYVELDNQLNKSNKEKEFTQEEAIMIANSLLDRCLNCGLDADNNLTNFYNYRNQYNWFIEEYGINKEGLKLQKKYSELTAEKKKRNESVKAKAFVN